MLVGTSLTIINAPEIDLIQSHGHLFITQPYDHYSEENHEAWSRLYARMLPSWQRYANPRFLQGIQALSLNPRSVPRLEEVNRFLSPLTGFRAKAVSGYVPSFTFFDCLRNREFPTTVTIRRSDQLDYLPEPDIFHDIAGHVPMHTDPHFAQTLVRFGECAHTAAKLDAPVAQLTSIIRALARFFWFTIEFGLMRDGEGLKVYGSGLLSSYSEIQHAIQAKSVKRYPLRLERVINQSFAIGHYQPLLFIVDSFEHMYDLVGELERWMVAGRLDGVAPGEPLIQEQDVFSFRPLPVD
jgi:phenylalanine-4-hydroxylase